MIEVGEFAYTPLMGLKLEMVIEAQYCPLFNWPPMTYFPAVLTVNVPKPPTLMY
jgi:hypothetical protein